MYTDTDTYTYTHLYSLSILQAQDHVNIHSKNCQHRGKGLVIQKNIFCISDERKDEKNMTRVDKCTELMNMHLLDMSCIMC